MRKTRQSTFETNSSSVHTIVCRFVKDETKYTGNVAVSPFNEEIYDGWILETPLEKMSYMLTHLKYEARQDDPTYDVRYTWLAELWREETGSELVYEPLKCEYPFGYLNHQVIGEFSVYFYHDEELFKEKMKHLIFNAYIQIELSHD